jgi:hypothetical protein
LLARLMLRKACIWRVGSYLARNTWGKACTGSNLPCYAVLSPVDEIVAATGFRPDLDVLREVRLDLDAIVESPRTLAPLIDPNVHRCGTVPPHGAEELRHPESDLYIVGMKSYGRAPTFLLRTGYEQVRSVVAALVGDWESATRRSRVARDRRLFRAVGPRRSGDVMLQHADGPGRLRRPDPAEVSDAWP